MKRSELLADLEFRFTEPEDMEKYGDDWFTYSELDIATLPSRRQIQLEQIIDSPIAAVMDGIRASSTFGDLAGTWIALTLAGRDIPWSSYNPKVMLAEWRTKELGKSAEVAVPTSEPATSETIDTAGTQTDMVVLQPMPTAG